MYGEHDVQAKTKRRRYRYKLFNDGYNTPFLLAFVEDNRRHAQPIFKTEEEKNG